MIMTNMPAGHCVTTLGCIGQNVAVGKAVGLNRVQERTNRPCNNALLLGLGRPTVQRPPQQGRLLLGGWVPGPGRAHQHKNK